MRRLAGWMMALALLVPGVAAAQTADKPAQLAALITANRWAVTPGPEGLGGPGGERIGEWAGQVQFFMLGENHGNAGMARFATALSETLGGKGYGATAVEADPLMVELVAPVLRGGTPALAAWLAQDQRQRAIPFYSWDAEAVFLESAMRRGAIWGLDQSFLAAGHLHLDAIAARTRSAEARTIATALAIEARADVMGFFGKVDMDKLAAMRVAMRRGDPAIPLTDQLIASIEIYAPYMRSTGSYRVSNLRRETQMKTLFLAGYRAAAQRDGSAPRVLFKLGANHLGLGLSATHVPSLGNFVSEFALAQGLRAFNLRMICGPGTLQTLFDASSHDCGADDFADLAGIFGPYLVAGGDTLFDLRPLRDRTDLWKDWPAEAKELVWSYDAIVVIGASPGSRFLAPLPQP